MVLHEPGNSAVPATARRTPAWAGALTFVEPSAKVIMVCTRATLGLTVMPALRITGSFDEVQPVNCTVCSPGGVEAGIVMRPVATPPASTFSVPSVTGSENRKAPALESGANPDIVTALVLPAVNPVGGGVVRTASEPADRENPPPGDTGVRVTSVGTPPISAVA